LVKRNSPGVQKGKSFDPSPEKKNIFIEAERVGYLMSANNSFRRRFDGAQYYPEKSWYVALISNPNQMQSSHAKFFERAL
jgi:hypothetical protein